MGERIEVGSLWRDRDPRMSGRTVRVESVEEGRTGYERVYYKHSSGRGARLSSRLDRFVKAFEQSQQPRSPHV